MKHFQTHYSPLPVLLLTYLSQYSPILLPVWLSSFYKFVACFILLVNEQNIQCLLIESLLECELMLLIVTYNVLVLTTDSL